MESVKSEKNFDNNGSFGFDENSLNMKVNFSKKNII